MVDVQVQGMDDLLKKLELLPSRIQKNVVVGAVRAGASGISKDAKKYVPKDLGVLRKSIGVTKRKMRVKTLVGFTVSPRKDLLVKGLIRAGKTNKRKVSKSTGFKYTTFDNYGGYVEFGTSKRSAKPYLRPAYEHMGPEAIRLARVYMRKRLDKELAKL